MQHKIDGTLEEQTLETVEIVEMPEVRVVNVFLQNQTCMHHWFVGAHRDDKHASDSVTQERSLEKDQCGADEHDEERHEEHRMQE